MSEFQINVVRLGKFESHPNADSLDITRVHDYVVIVKRGTFREGQLAVYLPIDSVVPDTLEWNWLAPHIEGTLHDRLPVGQVPARYRTIEAKRLRGIFSQGCLAPLPEGEWHEGDDVREVMGITKHDTDIQIDMSGEAEAAPTSWVFPTYTSIVGLRRYPRALVDGEAVVVTEKIHGANARYVHDGSRLWVGSHGQIKKRSATNVWWTVADACKLEERLAFAPWHVFFGEVYGQVQDLHYGVTTGARFRAFDVFNIKNGRYLNHNEARELATLLGVEWVPTLYQGPWDPGIVNGLCEGRSTLPGAENIREGFVVKPMVERWDPSVGRVILKRHGEGYLLRRKKR